MELKVIYQGYPVGEVKVDRSQSGVTLEVLHIDPDSANPEKHFFDVFKSQKVNLSVEEATEVGDALLEQAELLKTGNWTYHTKPLFDLKG